MKLALSIKGGTAKGLGSIGIYKYLKELGIKPSIVAGSSIGAIIASMIALDYSPSDMVAVFKTFKLLQLFSPTSFLIKGSAISYSKYRNKISQYLENYNVEDFKDPILRIFATRQNNGGRYFIENGNLIDAILASSAYPIYLPSPIVFNSIEMLDGDLSSSFSTQYLKSLGADIVIGASYDTSEKEKSVSKLGLLNRFSNFARVMISQVENYNLNLDSPDLLIKYSAKDISYLDLNKVDEIVDRGYEAAKSFKDSILRLIN